jgi:hypothetical protein
VVTKNVTLCRPAVRLAEWIAMVTLGEPRKVGSPPEGGAKITQICGARTGSSDGDRARALARESGRRP